MILANRKPVRFPEIQSLPDPFDGLLGEDIHHGIDVHSCMGCKLIRGRYFGWRADAGRGKTGAFNSIPDKKPFETFAALAAGIIRNISLFEALNKANRQQHSVINCWLTKRNKGGKLVGVSPRLNDSGQHWDGRTLQITRFWSAAKPV